jgi:membrane protein implicated in regulation of membrane protease activity
MTPTRYRRPLMICAAVVALLSLLAVGAVMAFAFSGSVAPVWVTSAALYGLPVAFLLMLFLILDSVAGRRRAGKSGGR